MNINLSIVIPCYNSEKTIEYCLDSIPEKKDIEIIIIDDCSCDSTVSIIKKYQKEHNKMIKLYENKENKGPGDSRNLGVTESKGNYIAFLDSDDKFSPDFYDEINMPINKNYDVIIYNATRIFNKCESNLFMFFSNGINAGEVDPKRALVFVKGCTCGKAYKSTLIKNNGIKFGNMRRNEDAIFTKSAVSFAQTVFFIDKPLYLYIDNSSSLSNSDMLLDPHNMEIGFKAICDNLNKDFLCDEINSLYFFEILYCLTISNLRIGKSIKEVKKIYKVNRAKYNKKDKYRKEYDKIYRFTFLLFELKAFRLYLFIRNILVLKNKQRRGI